MHKMDLRLWLYFITWILSSTGTLNQTMSGCTNNYNHDHCYININCSEYVDLNSVHGYQLQSFSECPNAVYYNGLYYPPVYFTYRRVHYDDEYIISWDSVYSNFITNVIVSVDISQNRFKILPPLTDMPKLQVLNFSNNLLTVAKLSSHRLYNNLVNIDFSFNVIKTIEVNNNENIYAQLEILDLSHNVLDNIPDTVFDMFSKLDHLNLSYNRLTVMNILSFVGVKNLKSLFLDYNDIIDINSSLLRLRDLQELSLKHNKLERISKRDFEKLVSLKKLDLSSNKIIEIEENAFDNMNFLSELDLSENVLDIIDKETFKYTINLSKIDLSVNNLKYLPKGLFKGRIISSFSIENNSIEGKLVNGMFLGLNNTVTLDIANQYVTSIEDYAFTGLEKLEILLLNNNKINTLSTDSFKSLQNIKRLDLSYNYIVNIDFDKTDLVSLRSFLLKNNLINYLNEGTFKSLGHLQFLDLSYNNISKIENKTFENLNNLITIEIKYNALVNALNSKIFKGLTQVPDLDISQSEISSVKNNTFQNMEQLQYLNLSHNFIIDLQFNTFIYTGNIATIDLSHNKLKYFLVNTTDLQKLGSLLINNNLLTKISSSTIQGLPNLLKVTFSYNNLSMINDKAFKNQASLLYLDLSFNPLLNFKLTSLPLSQNLQNLQISGTKSDLNSTRLNNTQLTELEICYIHINKVTNTTFNYFEHLEKLIVNNNDISIINNDTFYKVIYLEHLDLSNNRIKFIQSGSFKNNHKLKTLNLSHNSLADFNYGVFRGLISLDILDISFNNITNLQKEVLAEAENLKILKADNNRISDIDYFELKDIYLSELSIGDNPIPCKRVYELSRSVHFKITSIIRNEHNDNINGIKCHKGYPIHREKYFANENNDTEGILNILRSILVESSSGRSDEHSDNDDREHLTKITDLIQKSNSEVVQQLQLLNDASLSIKRDSNETHALLERLLRVLVTMNSAMKPPITPPSENVTLNDLTSYVSKIKQELENDIIIQKESVLAEVDSKISLAIARNKYFKENGVDGKEPLNNNSKVIEICVALLLSISCAFILYRTYKWCKNRSEWRSVSVRRRHITESVDNSTL